MSVGGAGQIDDWYVPRVVDTQLQAALRASPAVALEGPRACGKTSTGRAHAHSEVMFGSDRSARLAAHVDPGEILVGPEPRLLDEWQLAPEIWNQVRAAGDEGRRPGRFILTGSALPTDDITRHTGTGRITRVRMRPMSLFETGLSSGTVALDDLFSANVGFVNAPDPGLRDLVEATCRGGWPASLNIDLVAAQDYASSYLAEVCRTDIPQLGGPARDPLGVTRLLRSLARNVATEASESTLATDTGGERQLDRRTVSAYLDALERLFVVEDVPAWSIELRSRARLRQAAKRHLTDPSLAVAALGANPERLISDLGTFGLLFESLAVRDLRVYAESSRSHLAHYRDSSGLEVDIIIERGDGAWIALEIKLGGEAAIEHAAKSLRKLRDTVSDRRVGDPSNLVVVTANGYGFRREDGVQVVPLTALGP
ncbi:MAG: DUF4143 domain-containing protein [bacterium]|nr:DUF4143 domain-containing protein [bacterium]